MSKSGFQRWLDKFFPSDDGGHRTNALVEQGLHALRLARDERAFAMGDVTRVPSRMELRMSPERFDELKAMDAGRDLEFFFNDELMRDLKVDGMRTFGDHAIHITVAPDPDLGPDELYAEVLAPEAGDSSRPQVAYGGGSGGGVPEDSTRVMGAPDAGPATVAMPSVETARPLTYQLRITGPGNYALVEVLNGRNWLLGRRGSTGNPLPSGYRKLDLDVRETVSREQVKIDMMGDRYQVERIGKGTVAVGNDQMRESEKRILPIGASFFMDEYEVMISR
ncbi:MAG: hypothetical protein H7X80_02520 [bacterium]|nr:hypothetical protein [Candidatus Kapabacteria bacterium]